MPGKILPKAYWEKRADYLLKKYDKITFEQHGELVTICLMLETMDAELGSEKALQCGLAGHSEAGSEGFIFAMMSKECRHLEIPVVSKDCCAFYGRPASGYNLVECRRDICPLLGKKGGKG